MKTMLTISQFTLGVTLGVLIACSPTKFSQPTTPGGPCVGDSSVTSCIVHPTNVDYVQSFKVGKGKVDILFINDNSASMSKVQTQLGAKFSGFIQNLDNKDIDYRIAITTTDLASVTAKKLVTFGNGQSVLTKADADRVTLFNTAIRRTETIDCESMIISYFNTYQTNFQSAPGYEAQYAQKCASPDTRGLFTGNLVVSENADSFMRDDANLNVILISNDDVRQSMYATNSGFSLAAEDTASNFTSMMQSKYPTKYWDFNSIVVTDSSCKAEQTLRNAQGNEVRNYAGPAIAGGIGTQYINLSNSGAVNIDNQARTRGQVLNICQGDYSANFNSMATQISDSSRMFNLKCTPTAAPTVSPSTVPYTWNGDKITFQRGSEGIPVSISYRCYTGAL